MKGKNENHLTRTRARNEAKNTEPSNPNKGVLCGKLPTSRKSLRESGSFATICRRGVRTQKRIFADRMKRRASSFSQRAQVATGKRKSFPDNDGSAQQLSARGCHIRCANRRCVVKKVVSLLATPQIGVSTQQHTSFQIS